MIQSNNLQKALVNSKSQAVKSLTFQKDLDESNHIITLMNKIRGEAGLEKFDMNASEETSHEFIEGLLSNSKAITGATVAAGSGLAGTDSQPLFEIFDTFGGVFRASKFQTKRNASRISEFQYNETPGRMQLTVSGTSTTNDMFNDKMGTKLVTGYRYIGEVPINDDVLAAYSASGASAAQLVGVYKKYLPQAKLIAEDLHVARMLAVDTNIAPTIKSGASASPIAVSIIDALAKQRKYRGKTAVYLNHDVAAQLTIETDLSGVFKGIDRAVKFTYDPSVTHGKAGTFDGADLFIVPTLDSTYVDDGTGAVDTTTDSFGLTVPLTTGTLDIIFVGKPVYGAIHGSIPEKDAIKLFNSDNDLTLFRLGQTVIGSETYIGAGAINPIPWTYILV